MLVVTGFFDLQKREGTERRNLDHYLSYGKFLCSQEVPMILFTDPEIMETLQKLRPKDVYTVIIGVPFEEMPYQKYRGQLEKNRENSAMKLHPIKDTLNYQILNYSKISMIRRAMEICPDFTHYMWVDFGIAHVAQTQWVKEDEVFTFLPETIKYLQIRAPNEEILKDWTVYFSTLRWYAAGGVYAGPKELMTELCDEFDKVLEEMIQRELNGIDEQIFGMVAYRRPELFEEYHGDYATILANYKYIRGNINMIMSYMHEAREFKNYEDGCNLGNEVIESFEEGKFGGNTFEYITLLEGYYIAAYYIDMERAKEIADYVVELMKIEEMRLVIEKRREILNQNFAYVGVILPMIENNSS